MEQLLTTEWVTVADVSLFLFHLLDEQFWGTFHQAPQQLSEPINWLISSSQINSTPF